MAETKIRYITSIKQFEGYNYPNYKSKIVEKEFVRQYYSTLYSMSGLNACSQDLMNFLITVMDDENIVRNDVYVRNKFANTIKENTLELDGKSVIYSDSNVRGAFAALTKRGCLFKLSKGVYKVNPELFFRKEETKRLEAIKLCLEYKEGMRDPSMSLIYELHEPNVKYKSEENE